MNVLAGPFAALTVATLFYCYREYAQHLSRKNARLRERVAYMLWVMANGVKE